MHSEPRSVDFYEISKTKSVLTEVHELLTSIQQALFTRNIFRLEQYGWGLGSSYFGKVKGNKHGLFEYRLSLDKIELRILFVELFGNTFLMLAAYKEKRNSIPDGAIRSAEYRLKEWKKDHKVK